MDWYWTWQDPVALGLAVSGLFVALRGYRRSLRTGCASCPIRTLPTTPRTRRGALITGVTDTT